MINITTPQEKQIQNRETLIKKMKQLSKKKKTAFSDVCSNVYFVI